MTECLKPAWRSAAIPAASCMPVTGGTAAIATFPPTFNVTVAPDRTDVGNSGFCPSTTPVFFGSLFATVLTL